MSPAIPGDYISDLDPVQSITQLVGGLFEVELLAGPVAGAYVSRRLTTEQLVAYLLTQGLGGPLSPFQTVRFRTRAEANAPGAFGGAVLEEFDYSTLFTYARVQVEFWRDNPADLNEKPRGQELIAVYDPKADSSHMGYATSGGPAAGVSKLGLKLVFPDDPAATGVLQYDAAQAVKKTQLRYYDDGQGVEFYEALQDMVSPVPAPVRGTTTAYWKPTAPPLVPGGGAPIASLYYTIDEAKDKRDNGNLPDGRPTAAINDVWNGVGDNIVYLEVLETGRWARYGQLLDAQGTWSFVEVDLDQATATLVDATKLSRLINRTQALSLSAGGYLQPGSYVTTGPWNGATGAIALLPVAKDLLLPIGAVNIGGRAVAVVADLINGTYELFDDYVKRVAGGGGGSQGLPAVPISLAYNGTGSQTFTLAAGTVAVQFLTFNKTGQQLGRDDYALDTSVSPPTVTVNVPGAPADTLEGWVYTDPNGVIPVAPGYTDAQAAAAVKVDNLTVFKDANNVLYVPVRNDLVFRTSIGGQQTSGPYYISRLEAGNYQSQNTNPGVLNYSISVNGSTVAGARFSLAENDVLVVNYQSDVNGAIFTLRTI